GVPSAHTVATKPRRCSSTTRFMSAVRIPVCRSSSSNQHRVYNAALTEAFHVNFDDRRYAACPIQAFPTGEELRARAEAVGTPPVPPAPTVRVETETVDTGERREFFGRPARHVTTTRRVTPLPGSRCQDSQTVTDGWYIDLDVGARQLLACGRDSPGPCSTVCHSVEARVRALQTPSATTAITNSLMPHSIKS